MAASPETLCADALHGARLTRREIEFLLQLDSREAPPLFAAARADAGVRDHGVSIVSLEAGLAATNLLHDAAPVADLVSFAWVSPGSVAAVPAVPSGLTVDAQAALGARHIHEELAVGVAVMAVEALTGEVTPRA